MDRDFDEARANFNELRLELWDEPGRSRHESGNERRLLAVVFDLTVGRAAFVGAVARFPGRKITLRDRARVICESGRDEDIEWVRKYVIEAIEDQKTGPKRR